MDELLLPGLIDSRPEGARMRPFQLLSLGSGGATGLAVAHALLTSSPVVWAMVLVSGTLQAAAFWLTWREARPLPATHRCVGVEHRGL